MDLSKKLLRLPLSEAQDALLVPFRQQLEQMADAGVPGMLLAQIFGGEMLVGLVPGEQAVKLQEVMLTQGRTGRTIDDFEWNTGKPASESAASA